MKIILVIPSYRPGGELLFLVNELKQLGIDDILVVDDGSGNEYSRIFEKVKMSGCTVFRYEKNQGKGYALKYGFNKALEIYDGIGGFVTADADGQHKPEDIKRIFDMLRKNPDSVVLGCRDFKNKNVPSRSRLGNRFSSFVFRAGTGVRCPDTQTGLRAIPKSAFAMAVNTEGSRYEYEMNFLYNAVNARAKLIFMPIETVYVDNNKQSHFRPVADSARIFGTPVKFGFSSVISAVFDILLFVLFSRILFPVNHYIIISNVSARILSGLLNFTLNRAWSFKSSGPAKAEMIKYFLLFTILLFFSTALLNILSFLPVPVVIIKIFVDLTIFTISYFVQKIWVFRKERHHKLSL